MSAIGGLEPEQSQNIIAILKNIPGIHSAVLFGSRAKGNFSPGSDIDIAVHTQNLSIEDLQTIHEKYDALYLPWKLDIADYTHVQKKELIEHIQRVGIRLF